MTDFDGNFAIQLGRFIGLIMQRAQSENVVQGTVVSLGLAVGSSGTPVVDREGRLLGLVEATDLKETAGALGNTVYLIPADEALAFVNEGDDKAQLRDGAGKSNTKN